MNSSPALTSPTRPYHQTSQVVLGLLSAAALSLVLWVGLVSVLLVWRP